MTSTLGVMGGGQLGMFFCRAARRRGYRVVVLDPDPSCPASTAADEHLVADFSDEVALTRLSESCEAVTVEFENVPRAALERLAETTIVRPAGSCVATASDRRVEKNFLRSIDAPVVDFRILESVEDLSSIPAEGVVVKTATLGYDGKGQVRVDGTMSVSDAWESLGRRPCVVEDIVSLDREFSVVSARSVSGDVTHFETSRNVHRHGVLDSCAIGLDEPFAPEARTLVEKIATELDYVGVLAVEFFVSQGRLLVNEIAPRPHNSGHWTIDGASVSQFDQQVVTVAGDDPLPVGPVDGGVAMVNLLGDLWVTGEPRWNVLDGEDGVHLHLYGKAEARSGRKMGHLTVVRESPEVALAVACEMRERLIR